MQLGGICVNAGDLATGEANDAQGFGQRPVSAFRGIECHQYAPAQGRLSGNGNRSFGLRGL